MNNQIDKNLYSEKSLNILNIKDLRELGRKFGVPSPTTLKKQELIEYILKIVYGEVDAPMKSSFGRPTKNEFNLGKCLEKIRKNSDISDELSYISLDNPFVMKVADKSKETELKNIETRVFSKDENLLKVHKFISSKNDLTISKEIVEKLKLEDLDVVEIAVSDEFFKIVSVNGLKVRNNFENLKIKQRELCSGQQQVFYVRTKDEIYDEINNIAIFSEQKDISVMIFGENNYDLKYGKSFVYSCSDENSMIYKKLMNFVSECEMVAFSNEDVIIIFENYNYLGQVLSSFEEDVCERIKKYLQDKLKNLAGLGNIVVGFNVQGEFLY